MLYLNSRSKLSFFIFIFVILSVIAVLKVCRIHRRHSLREIVFIIFFIGVHLSLDLNCISAVRKGRFFAPKINFRIFLVFWNLLCIRFSTKLVTPRAHRQILCFSTLESTLRTRELFIPCVLDSFSPNMIITEANFTLENSLRNTPSSRQLDFAKRESSLNARAYTKVYLETAPLAKFVARATFVVFRVEDLTFGLVLELVVFAEIAATERALEHSPSVIPHSSFTLEPHFLSKKKKIPLPLYRQHQSTDKHSHVSVCNPSHGRQTFHSDHKLPRQF